MNHMKAFSIKFIVSLVLLSIVLGLFYNVSFGDIFIITLLLGVISYSLGDMVLLPRTNNTIATMADFGLAFLVIWLFGDALGYGANIFIAALIAAVGVALFEFFFHKYVAKFRENNLRKLGNLRYQTEASEELTPSELKKLNPTELKNRNKDLID